MLVGRLERDGRSVSWNGFWAAVRSTALVVVDDLGARDRVSDHAYETLKKVLDSREGRPLIALSNARLSELARVYDDRIASRLSAGTLIALDEPDQRLKKE